ncbi:MAG: hypothetical protein A2X13_07975 [Bacteroidetes bacterium GWC2_33_15]|nr:MAG: hypothetical protein A2X10_05030 [Bacteroidetes bacterium GWA2_33_15]OFX52683.1 MAG: hypothetical protein A2X13_07975 [Bacteroidetes bacterium GWC2_33_15]OFX64011.1 MAG: hypothetical protein A2X15_02360 [Bacteroidetes bacterium GWB2_32_14]OFX67304.1 MAG: hypothetical protein A2X14_12055 [Bacteroidetes bacterium GWD2_33_33]HAN18832.1 hypothetical protein [Bacteroidales bacterium]
MRNQKHILFIFCFLFSFSGSSITQEYCEIIDGENRNKWYIPDCIKIQHAGNIGFISVGFGYTWWNEVIQTDMLYGYVPTHEGETTIHTFTIKNTFRLYQFRIKQKYNISPVLGFSVSLEPGYNSYLRVPGKYPEGYYYTNSIYAVLNLGMKSKFELDKKRFFSRVEPFVEVNTLADYLFYNIIAWEYWGDDILSLALGINLFF